MTGEKKSNTSQKSSHNSSRKSFPKTKTYKYRLHPDPTFDPSEYLLADDIRSRRPETSFRKELQRHRFGFYRFYGKTFSLFAKNFF